MAKREEKPKPAKPYELMAKILSPETKPPSSEKKGS